MSADKNWMGLAVDLGASSGRVIAGRYDGDRLVMEEMHRFPNEPVEVNGTLYWDILRLYHEIKEGLRAAHRKATESGERIVSVGLDTWGVDFGLIDDRGRLLGNPVHYRDARNEGVMEKVFAQVPAREIYSRAGIQFLQFNTIFQVAGMKMAGDPHLDQAEALLMVPDLFHYFLTGVKANEYSEASTSSLLDAEARDWSGELLESVGVKRSLFQRIVQPGETLGPLLPEVSEDLGGLQTNVVAAATHDTGSAVVSVPTRVARFAYLSCGTWSLLGTETTAPVLTEEARALAFTNEGGAFGTIRLLKNIMGLWLLQETRNTWIKEGRKFTWAEMTTMTEEGAPHASFVDPDDLRFMAPGDMPARIRAFCQETGQNVPSDEKAILRTITESLALKYRHVLESLEQLIGYQVEAFHMVGGGIQNELLCQWTANALGRPVLAGPVEGTAIGNLAVQMISAGVIADVAEARAVVARSFEVKKYEPVDIPAWQAAFERFAALVEK